MFADAGPDVKASSCRMALVYPPEPDLKANAKDDKITIEYGYQSPSGCIVYTDEKLALSLYQLSQPMRGKRGQHPPMKDSAGWTD